MVSSLFLLFASTHLVPMTLEQEIADSMSEDDFGGSSGDSVFLSSSDDTVIRSR
jgi:hypothetical protein